MNDRFTDRANKVMELANQEALRFNHEYIGTEHILLGLIKEGSGVASTVLKDRDVDLCKIRLEVEKCMRSGPGPPTTGKLPQTPRAKKVIEYSMEEARNHGSYVNTADILLGLLREQDGAAAQVLVNLGLKLEEVREEVLRLLGCEDKTLEEAINNAPADGTIAEIRESMDLAENADKHVGDSVSTDAPIRYSPVRLGKETGDVTLTGEPLNEPLVNVLASMIDPLDPLGDAIRDLASTSENEGAKVLALAKMAYARQHAGMQKEAIKNLQQTIRTMRAASTKMRDANDSQAEKTTTKIMECVIECIDNMLDSVSTDAAVASSGAAAKGLCRGVIHLASISALIEKSKAASAERHCRKPWPTPPAVLDAIEREAVALDAADPQAEAQAAGLAAVEQAMEIKPFEIDDRVTTGAGVGGTIKSIEPQCPRYGVLLDGDSLIGRYEARTLRPEIATLPETKTPR